MDSQESAMALILIVDDSQYQRNMIRKMLETEGHGFLEAEDGLTAIKMALAEKPDCILVDKLMPDFDGVKFLHFVKQNKLAIPVIVVTADIQQSTYTECIELGAFAVLNKPVKAEKLKEIIHEALFFQKKDAE
jgi:CheY-like chemotaxis protein